MFQRMRLCFDSLIRQLEKFKIPSELILVEWLPPADKPLLRDVYPWPRNLEYVRIRVIVVPSTAIGDYDYTEEFAIRDLTPWNVAIRRAAGRFILSTVADSLFSDALIAYIADENLHAGKIYRIDRCDVNRAVLEISSPEEWLAYCEGHIIDMHTLNPLKFLLKPKIPVLHDKAPGDFILMSRAIWHKIRGFPQGIAPGADHMLLYMAYLSGAQQEIMEKPLRLYHIDHDSSWKSPSYTLLRKLMIRWKIPFPLVDILSHVGERLFPVKSEWEKKNLCQLSAQTANDYVAEMVGGKRSYIFNGEDWGLGHQNLEEFSVGH